MSRRVGSVSVCRMMTGTFFSFSTPAASAAAAPTAAAKARKLERDADRRRHRALFPGIAIEVHHRGLATQQPSAWCDDDGREAVRARHRNGVAVVVERDLRAELRIEVLNV